MDPDDEYPGDGADDDQRVDDEGPDDEEGLGDVPDAPRTGDDGVDEAVARLAEAVRGPVGGQVAAFDAAHRALQDRLADVES